MNFRENLHTAWKNSGLKQSEFCQKLNIPYPTFHKWVSGQRTPDEFKQKAVLSAAEKIVSRK